MLTRMYCVCALAYLWGGGRMTPLTSNKQKERERKRRRNGGKRMDIFFFLSARILSKIRCGNNVARRTNVQSVAYKHPHEMYDSERTVRSLGRM